MAPAKEPGRQTADLHLSFCLPRPNPSVSPPALCQNTACNLFCLSAPISCGSIRSSTPNLSPPTLLHPSPQLLQASHANPKDTPTKEAGRLHANLPLLLFLQAQFPQSLASSVYLPFFSDFIPSGSQRSLPTSLLLTHPIP